MNSKTRTELLYVIVVLVVLMAAAGLNIVYVLGHESNIATAKDPSTVPAGSTVINVTGYQWAWEFAYPNGTSSTDVLWVHVNTEYTFRVISKDVIHDLLIPALGLQVYAVPGHPNQVSFSVNKVGSYIFECVEYCGEDHYLMRGTMEVLS